jgi:hypothetical protein
MTMGSQSTLTERELPRWSSLNVAIGLCLFALFVTHLVSASWYFVNVPFWDGWENLRPGGLSSELNLSWIFTAHNVHIIVPTRIETWMLYRLNHWDIEFNLWLNFFIWGSLVLMTFLVMRRFSGGLSTSLLLLFTAFQLSAISWENHGWAFQSQFHWCLLFLMMSLYLLFDPKQRGFSLSLGSTSLVFCLFSFGAGIAGSFGLMFGFLAYRVARSYSLDISVRRQERIQTLTALCIYLGGVFLWAALMSNVDVPSGPLAFPYHARFWKFFLRLASVGYGFHESSWPFVQLVAIHRHLHLLVDLLLIALLVLPGFLLARRFRKVNVQEFATLSGMLAVLGMLAAISMGRANFILTAQNSRYSEIAVLLVPFGMLAWQHALTQRPRLRTASFWILTSICLVGFYDNWDYRTPYRDWSTGRIRGVGRVVNYYEKGGSSRIPMLYLWDLRPMLERAKDLEVSFYQRLILDKE